MPPLSARLYPHHRKRFPVSLRLGHVAALTVHRTVIHYRVDTALPLESFKGRLWRVSVFLLPQSLARQLPRRRSPHLTINLSNFTQTPQSASLTATLKGRPWWGGAVHGCGYVWKGVVILATVHGFMILCPRWYREGIGIIDFLERIISLSIILSI